jgi:hypothetical protein
MAFLDETGLADLWALVRNADVKMATGTYKGNGTSGSSKKNTLTFNFVPKMLLIGSGYSTFGMWWHGGDSLCVEVTNSGATKYQNSLSISGNTISWYATGSYTTYSGSGGSTADHQTALHQLNSSGVTYHYIAIG